MQHFVGRADKLTELHTLLVQALQRIDDVSANNAPTIIYLHGIGGMGKTWLLNSFIAQVRQSYSDHCTVLPTLDWREAVHLGKNELTRLEPADVYGYLHYYLDTYKPHKPVTSSMPATHTVNTIAGNIDNNTGMVAIGKHIQQQINHGPMFIVNGQHDAIHTKQVLDSLGNDLRRLSQYGLLLICFDSYELINEAETVLEQLARQGGKRIMWIIAGRTPPQQTKRPQSLTFHGSAPERDEAPSRIVIPLQGLSAPDIARYITLRGLHLATDQLSLLHYHTQGMPLAVSMAVELIRHHQTKEQANQIRWLFPESRDTHFDTQILVKRMVDYLLHTSTNITDRRDLFSLGLIHTTDPGLAANLLETDDLHSRLHQLSQQYTFVNTDLPALDKTVQFFLCQKRHDSHNIDTPLIRTIAQRAQHYCHQQLQQAQHQRVEQLMDQDQHWRTMLVEYLHHSLYLTPAQAAVELVAAFCCAILYAPSYCRHLLALINDTPGNIPTPARSYLDHLPRHLFWTYTDWTFAQLIELTIKCQNHQIAWYSELTDPQGVWNEARTALYTRWGMAYDPTIGAISTIIPKDRSQAEHLYQQARIQGQFSTLLYTRLGQLSNEIGRHTGQPQYFLEAITYSKQAAAQEWHRQRAASNYNDIGTSYYQLGDFLRALHSYEQAREIYPHDAVVYLNQGFIYYCQADFDQAIDHYNDALKIDKTLALAFEYRGLAHHSKGHYHEAMEDYAAALAHSDSPRIYVHRGNAYRALKQYEQALGAYTQALHAEPDDPRNYVLRAMIHAYLGVYADAMADLNHAARMVDTQGRFDDWIAFGHAVVAALQYNSESALQHLMVALKCDRVGTLRDLRNHRQAFARLSAHDPEFGKKLERLIGECFR